MPRIGKRSRYSIGDLAGGETNALERVDEAAVVSPAQLVVQGAPAAVPRSVASSGSPRDRHPVRILVPQNASRWGDDRLGTRDSETYAGRTQSGAAGKVSAFSMSETNV